MSRRKNRMRRYHSFLFTTGRDIGTDGREGTAGTMDPPTGKNFSLDKGGREVLK